MQYVAGWGQPGPPYVLLGQGAVTPSLALILFPVAGIPHGGS